jgi:hypothetical protein
MQQIDIDFDVYKALTILRKHERHSYNDVLRVLLKMDPFLEPSIIPEESTIAWFLDERDKDIERLHGTKRGFVTRGRFLPNGSRLRATYKSNLYKAEIIDGKFVDENGCSHSSPSAAASSVTGNNVNGLRFWEAQRPTDVEWRRLDMLPILRS